MGSSSGAAPAKLEARPIAGSLGAEVIGLDVSAVSAVADELKNALDENLVLNAAIVTETVSAPAR